MLEIPLPTDNPNFRQEVELIEGQSWFLNFRWNARAQAFFLAIDDATGERLVSGLRVVVSWPLLRRFSDKRLPPFELVVLDTEGADKDPVLGELGARARLFYVSSDDIDAAAG